MLTTLARPRLRSYGEAYGEDPNTPFLPPALHSTATTALGAHLSRGTFYGMGESCCRPGPSNISR